MSTGFKLLSVSHVVKTEIFDHFEPYEIATLSLCSKRSHNFAKSHRKKTKTGKLFMSHEDSNYIVKYDEGNTLLFGTRLHYNDTYTIMRVLDSSNKPEYTDTVKINGFEIPVAMNSDGFLNTFWEDKIFGMKTVTDYVMRLFKMDVTGIFCDKEHLWMIDHVNSLQDSLQCTEIDTKCHKFTEEEYRHIIMNCKPTFRLNIYIPAPRNFIFTGTFFPTPTRMRIDPSQWVTLENLKSMNGVDIILNKSSLKSSEMNLFLKHWLAGGNPHLRILIVDMKFRFFNRLFFGLQQDFIYVREQRLFTCGIYRIYLSGTYDIRRKDGALASVKLMNNGHFNIYVWPLQGE